MKDFSKIHFKGEFRDYQQRVLNHAEKYLHDGKINIVASPGSGKTILGLELIRRLNSPCIILSPTTTIRHQWGDRFASGFLDENEHVEDYVSYDLNQITLMNSITYQALYSAMNKILASSEEEEVDYSNIDLFKLVAKYQIKTICLDEAHHLQNEWQKALEIFIKGLDKEIKIISLTATPPYDAKINEWGRYIDVCGEIDEEIFVPELVKQQTLCPHQDYIFFNYPTESEIQNFREYRERAFAAIEEIAQLTFFKICCDTLNRDYKNQYDEIFSNAKEYIALLIYFRYANFPINKKLLKLLTGRNNLPGFNLHYGEVAIQFLLKTNMLSEENKNALVDLLKKSSLIEKKNVSLDLNEKLKRKLVSSIGKLDSICRIVESETDALKEKLRMLILTDYIKKESIADIGSNTKFDQISVVSIFESIRRRYESYNIGVLSGSLVILPLKCEQILADLKIDKKRIVSAIKETRYGVFDIKGTNKDKVDLVSYLFEKGHIHILIGTKSLLGEGWDSPCINSLILASFIGSFMLSNQMRGRAIRIHKEDPNKTANIWHLATIEPDYILESNVLKKIPLYVNQSDNIIKSFDYETLTRRFDCFVGPNYTTGEIESGIDRITLIKPPNDYDGIHLINKNMLNRSRHRNQMKEIWENALVGSSQLIFENEIPKDRKVPAFTFHNIGMAMIILALEGNFITMMINGLMSGLSHNFNAAYFIVGLVFSIIMFYYLNWIVLKILAHINPSKSMKSLADCILKTLKEMGTIESACHVKVKSDEVGTNIHLSITDASIHEQNIFNTAITELLSPIENPRYLLIKKSFFGSYNYSICFACPTVIGQKKEYAEIFEKYLARTTGRLKLLYTRNENGRALIIKCRKKAYISYNSKQLNKKKKISRWE